MPFPDFKLKKNQFNQAKRVFVLFFSQFFYYCLKWYTIKIIISKLRNSIFVIIIIIIVKKIFITLCNDNTRCKKEEEKKIHKKKTIIKSTIYKQQIQFQAFFLFFSKLHLKYIFFLLHI
jgi:hypothetical protein